jgi:hypothetical protein
MIALNTTHAVPSKGHPGIHSNLLLPAFAEKKKAARIKYNASMSDGWD